MDIKINSSLQSVLENGTQKQKAAIIYFDFNGNGILEKNEIDSFNKSDIQVTDESLTIKMPDGYVDKFENIYNLHPDYYYSDGNIPVAVIDDFVLDNGCAIRHGTAVSNIIKKINPDISISRLNSNQTLYFNPLGKMAVKLFNRFPKFESFIWNNSILQKGERILMGFDKAVYEAHNDCLDKVLEKMNSNNPYKAINMSLSFDCTYEEINKITKDVLGVELNSENIAQYKNEIKDILREKQNQKIKTCSNSTSDTSYKIKQMLNLIDKMEKTKIPVFLASSYTQKDGSEVFNILSLADNAKTIEAGKITDGKITHGHNVSRNSFALDENGKRRLEDSLHYEKDELVRGSTSYAAPMALAKFFL